MILEDHHQSGVDQQIEPQPQDAGELDEEPPGDVPQDDDKPQISKSLCKKEEIGKSTRGKYFSHESSQFTSNCYYDIKPSSGRQKTTQQQVTP